MVAVLPVEVLDIVRRQWPCREAQIRTIASLYNGIFVPPPILIAHGPEGTNKLGLLNAVLEARKSSHAAIKCRECLSQRHLLGKIFAACAQALHLEEVVEQYDRVDSINALAVNLQRLFEKADQRFVLVLDAVDDLKGAGPTLLPALARLGDLIPSLSLILTTTSPRPLPLHRSGVPYIHFPPYNRSEAVHIVTTTTPNLPPDLSSQLKAEDLPKIYKQFAITVYDALISSTTTSITTYQQVLHRLWPRFIWPAISGEAPPGKSKTWDFSRLLVRNRTLFHASGEAVLLDSIQPTSETWTFEDLQSQHAQTSSSTPKTTHPPTPPPQQTTTLLNPLPTLLLLATHLTSHTPAKHDILLFSRLSTQASKHRKIRYIKRGNPGATPKKANEDGRRRDKTKSLAPRACGLERILAVARAVSGEVIGGGKGEAEGWSDRVARAMGELERLRLVGREDGDGGSGGGGGGGGGGAAGEGGEAGGAAATTVGCLGGGRWKINVGREVVVDLAGRHGLGVLEWEMEV